ncbi:MAG: LysR substrate-binding domain-containing protein [Amaricoccus sp.]|uniref:LysR substrate-binding domain-containing protein n=1 Tax=Amaricoccus sp. TaxID=1872485 RepID=UPI0039E5485F
MRHLDPEAIATFVAVVDAGGFTAAARRIGKSQAGVSVTIARFEAQLGRRLFDRSRRGLELTETGQALVSYARRLIALEDEALAAIDPRRLEGRVTLGMPDDYIDVFGRPLVEHFSAAGARLEIEIRCDFSRGLEALVRSGEIDMAIITRATGTETGELLRREPLVWCGPEDAHPERSDPLPLALFPERDCRARPLILAALAAGGRAWRVNWTSSHLPSIQAALDAGTAITALPASVIAPRHRRMGPADGLPLLEPLDLALLVPDGARVAVRKLATFLRERFQAPSRSPADAATTDASSAQTGSSWEKDR